MTVRKLIKMSLFTLKIYYINFLLKSPKYYYTYPISYLGELHTNNFVIPYLLGWLKTDHLQSKQQ